jgi:hypothetical protein
MSRLNLRSLGLAAAALIAAGVAGTAQIERLTLDQMVAKTDNSVVGEITKKEVIRIDHPIDGPELYFTHLTVEGRSLVDGKKMTAVVTYPGGFIDDENGVWNSEAPSDEDTKLGNQVVVFFKHTKNLGGDLEADALYASHGGLFRTAKSQSGTVVLGRGEGYAISDNTQLSVLDESVTELHQAQQDARK